MNRLRFIVVSVVVAALLVPGGAVLANCFDAPKASCCCDRDGSNCRDERTGMSRPMPCCKPGKAPSSRREAQSVRVIEFEATSVDTAGTATTQPVPHAQTPVALSAVRPSAVALFTMNAAFLI